MALFAPGLFDGSVQAELARSELRARLAKFHWG